TVKERAHFAMRLRCLSTRAGTRGRSASRMARRLYAAEVCVDYVDGPADMDATAPRHCSRDLRRPAIHSLSKHSAQENMNQMPFVIRAAFVIVDQVRSIGNCLGSLRQPLLDLGAWTGE